MIKIPQTFFFQPRLCCFSASCCKQLQTCFMAFIKTDIDFLGLRNVFLCLVSRCGVITVISFIISICFFLLRLCIMTVLQAAYGKQTDCPLSFWHCEETISVITSQYKSCGSMMGHLSLQPQFPSNSQCHDPVIAYEDFFFIVQCWRPIFSQFSLSRTVNQYLL